uniref:Granulocyte colony-stimulating factor n=1 Tax=Oryzias sinensis TaxID=183150 RepID=A0A8C8DEX1_9TELE
MNSTTALVLLHCYLLAAVVTSAPSSPPSFREAVEGAKTLVEKILEELPPAYSAAISAQGFSLDSPIQNLNLHLMSMSLQIPGPPVLKPFSDSFTLETCVSRMLAGVQLHQNLLAVLSGRLAGLEELKADVRDLLAHIMKLKEAALMEGGALEQNRGSDLDARLTDSYTVQVAAHTVLTQLRSFCHDLTRSFRALATYRL